MWRWVSAPAWSLNNTSNQFPSSIIITINFIPATSQPLYCQSAQSSHRKIINKQPATLFSASMREREREWGNKIHIWSLKNCTFLMRIISWPTWPTVLYPLTFLGKQELKIKSNNLNEEGISDSTSLQFFIIMKWIRVSQGQISEWPSYFY